MFKLLAGSLICSSIPVVAMGILVLAFLIWEHGIARKSDDRQDETGHW